MKAHKQLRVYSDDSERRKRIVSSNREVRGGPGVTRVDGGIILPLRDSTDGFHKWAGGVLDREGTFVAGHFYDPTKEHNRNIIAGYPLSSEPRKVAGRVVYAGGSGADHFGHFLSESLARLWWILEQEDTATPVVMNTRNLREGHGLMAFLTMMGIDEDRIIVLREPTRFDEVVVPDQVFHLGSGTYFPKQARLIYDAIRDSVPRGGVERVYLTRTGFQDQSAKLRELNEQMFEDFYRSQGYEIVSPERLSLRDQVSLLSGVNALASTGGTLSHLVLFCQNQVTQDVILRSPRSFRLHGQWGMSQLREATLRVIDTTIQLLPGSHWAGVISYASTPRWVEYARAEFGAVVPSDADDRQIMTIIREWTDLMSTASSRDLQLFPAWTVSDFVASFHKVLLGSALDTSAATRLDDRFRQPAPAEREPTVTIRFVPNGGTPINDLQVPLGRPIGRIASPTREGHVFAGWYTSPRLRTRFDVREKALSDKTLHARWRRLEPAEEPARIGSHEDGGRSDQTPGSM